MVLKYKIGFIGFGQMARAIWHRLDKKSEISFCECTPEYASQIGQEFSLKPRNLAELVEWSECLLFCVKPQAIDQILSEFPKIKLSQKCLITILAGTPISVFEKYLGSEIQMVRVMPNTPAVVGEAMSALYFKNVNQNYREWVIDLFSTMGTTQEIKTESQLDIVTGISGSGPAFLYKIADAIAKVGEQEGLDYNTSLKLIAQTMRGAGKMLLTTPSPPDLIKQVASPGGTTQAGLDIYNRSEIDSQLQAVITGAIVRSREIMRGCDPAPLTAERSSGSG
uniref:NADP oxidoreductase coenzyme F420-dependent n=1 Tax=Marseillevirus LCMAC201 TaxID=2506605 RepID=A0A481YWH3_9VIRU|nr:MAG: NADP oxidoreductase coenzyme F420-dependent [Marseillevirus LCMAC201]